MEFDQIILLVNGQIVTNMKNILDVKLKRVSIFLILKSKLSILITLYKENGRFHKFVILIIGKLLIKRSKGEKF